MTAPPDELADLRRRVYGPEAQVDGRDLARLQSLEDALRAGSGTSAPAGRGERQGASVETADASVEPAPLAEPAIAPPVPVRREALRATFRRRRVVLILFAVAVVAALASGVWSTSRSDATVLRRVEVNDSAAQQQLASSLRNFGVDPDSYVQFESFEDLSVWTARIPDRGVRCLLIVDAGAANATYSGVLDYSCTPEGLAPSVDVVQFAPDGDLGDRPVGSVARFVFQGDRVETSVVRAREEPDVAPPPSR